MRLPIPVHLDGRVVTDVKLKEATAEVIAATRREVDSGAQYSAMLEWCAGVTSEMTGPDGVLVSSRDEVRRATRAMAFESAWAVACFGMAETRGSDSVPGAYKCPSCGNVVLVGRSEQDGEEVDTSDHLSLIDYEVCEADAGPSVTADLDTPVEIFRRDTSEVVERVESVTLSYPTMGQCIRAQQKCPDDASGLMFLVYAECLSAVNGRKVEPNWRTAYGEITFKRMTARDLNRVTGLMKRYSISHKVERACMRCKTRWEADLDLSGFFASGLDLR